MLFNLMLHAVFRTTLLSILFLIPVHSWSQFDADVRGQGVVYLPSSYTDSNFYPLVILLHGYGTDTNKAELIWRFSESVDKYGFVYAIPSGTVDQSGSYFWNSNSACCNFYNSTVDDGSYLYEYIENLKDSLNIDANRIYVVGDSNGGFMALELAYRFPELIAASVSSAGASHLDARNNPNSGVHILQIQGTDDSSILYDGGSIAGVPYPGAEATALQWAGYNKCFLSSSYEEPRDLDVAILGLETEVIVYNQGCRKEGSVELWTILKGGHGLGRPVPESSRLQLLEWLFRKAKTGWPSEFNGVVPPIELDLDVNNIGAYNTLDGIIYSCFELRTQGEASFFEGSSRFDVGLAITDATVGKIKLIKYRPFNAANVLNKNSEPPNCSGTLELSTGIYSDIVQVETAYYKLNFQLLSPESSEFKLLSLQEI